MVSSTNEEDKASQKTLTGAEEAASKCSSSGQPEGSVVSGRSGGSGSRPVIQGRFLLLGYVHYGRNYFCIFT